MSQETFVGSSAEPNESLVTWAHIIYALHATSLVIGIVGVATLFGAFLFGWPSIIAVIMNYIKQGEARGTYLDSHFRWQIRTFWFGLLWFVAVIAVAGAFGVITLGIGFLVSAPLAIGTLGLVGLWFIYRIARGWLRLKDKQPMYV